MNIERRKDELRETISSCDCTKCRNEDIDRIVSQEQSMIAQLEADKAELLNI